MNEMSDCSSALRPEISTPLEVSRLIAIAKQDEPVVPEEPLIVVEGNPAVCARYTGQPVVDVWYKTVWLKSFSNRTPEVEA